jgi:hypothetical protein
MEYEVFVTPGLGDSSYLLSSDGEAVVVARSVTPCASWPLPSREIYGSVTSSFAGPRAIGMTPVYLTP